ncbi:MAG: Hsp20/alpha crystallin family protein [Candidatus Micrarchaeia archaeon]
MAKKRELAVRDFFEPYDPFREFERFERLFSFPRLFSDFSMPDIDVIDEGDSLKVKADMPGVDKQDIKIRVNGNNLTIKAEKEEEKEDKDKNYYYKERSSRHYYRTITLPAEVDAKSAKASMKNGILEISLKKKGEAGEEVKVE